MIINNILFYIGIISLIWVIFKFVIHIILYVILKYTNYNTELQLRRTTSIYDACDGIFIIPCISVLIRWKEIDITIRFLFWQFECYYCLVGEDE